MGLQELGMGYHLQHSIRQVLCVLTLLAYHLMVVYTLSDNDGDLVFCEEILKGQLQVTLSKGGIHIHTSIKATFSCPFLLL